jgi:undecaprenyl-diphosphatase
MPNSVATARSQNYFLQLFVLLRLSVMHLVRAPAHARRAIAARRLGRDLLLLTAVGGALIVVLMVAVDTAEIMLMPPRGSPDLWWVRIVTDFGKDLYVLSASAAALLAVTLACPLLAGTARGRFLRLGTQLEYIFLSLLCSNLIGDVLKYAVGRGRPFVGGKANAFNFVPFAGTEAYFSLPSAHVVTAVALAFAVGAIWPRLRLFMFAYAVVIAATRLVLLAHHPSDVVAGAVVGLLGAMVVRYWFAVRRLAFAIRENGGIAPF